MDREDVSTTISATKTTTIAVSRETKEVLRRIGEKGESYDDIIRGLLSKIAWEEADKRWNKILEEDEFIRDNFILYRRKCRNEYVRVCRY
ncbi:MAG: DUF7557 family protein [Candidatus Helarchaeota archaeon]